MHARPSDTELDVAKRRRIALLQGKVSLRRQRLVSQQVIALEIVGKAAQRGSGVGVGGHLPAGPFGQRAQAGTKHL